MARDERSKRIADAASYEYGVASKAAADVLARWERERWLERSHYIDPAQSDFAFNTLTKRLSTSLYDDEAGTLAALKPMVVVVAVPDPPLRAIIDTGGEKLWNWLGNPNAHRYQPDPGGIFLRGDVRATIDGAIVEDRRERNGEQVVRFLSIEKTGIVHLGLSYDVCGAHRGRVAFYLTPIVGYVWQFLGFTLASYREFAQERAFTLLVNVRGTKRALLAVFAQGWRDPHEGFYAPECMEEGIRISRESLAAQMQEEEVATLVRGIASELDLFWGHRPPRCYEHSSNDSVGAFATGVFQRRNR